MDFTGFPLHLGSSLTLLFLSHLISNSSTSPVDCICGVSIPLNYTQALTSCPCLHCHPLVQATILSWLDDYISCSTHLLAFAFLYLLPSSQSGLFKEISYIGDTLVVWRLGLHTFIAEGLGSTKTLQATQHGQKREEKKRRGASLVVCG